MVTTNDAHYDSKDETQSLLDDANLTSVCKDQPTEQPPLASVWELLCVHEQNRVLIACLAVQAISWIANSAVTGFLPQAVVRQGIEVEVYTMGLIFAAAPLSNFLSAPLAGWLNGEDLCGRKWVLLTGLLLFTGSGVAMGFGVNIAESISDADHKTAVVTAIFLSCRLLQGTHGPTTPFPRCSHPALTPSL